MKGEHKRNTRKKLNKERYGKVWKHVYLKGKPALKHNRTKEIVFPSDKYVKKHHPQGAWDS